jgi:hypothetical protein
MVEPASLPHSRRCSKKLGAVERWTKILLIVTIVYGLVLGGIYLYHLVQHGI